MNARSTLFALGAALLLCAGCSKDATPDSMTRDVIIETGYVECVAPTQDCDGVTRCTEANDAEICVQAPADECIDALTCDCVGAWVCGDLACADIDGGFTCGEPPEPEPEPEPEAGCLRLEPVTIDFGDVLVSTSREFAVRVVADCAAQVDSVALIDDSDPAFSLIEAPFEPYALAAGESRDLVIVRVQPLEPGVLTGELRVNGDPAAKTNLTANAMRPIGGNCLEVDPAQIDFGLVPIRGSREQRVQIAVNCDGVLSSELTQDTADNGSFRLVSPIDGPVQAGEGTELVIEVSAEAAGEIRGALTLTGVGAPVRIPLSAETIPTPDCRENGCVGDQVCNSAGQCVNEVVFVVEFEAPEAEMYVQLWPINEAPHLVIGSVDNEFTAFNPGSIFEPCDACDAAPDCAERPETVGALSQMAPLSWDHTWWLTDTPDGDDCARPQIASAGLYSASICGAREADVEGMFDESGTALGTLNQSFCLVPTQFDLATGGEVVLTVRAE